MTGSAAHKTGAAPDIYLGSCLEPVAVHLAAPDVTDIFINRPGEVWTESLGQMPVRHDAPRLTESLLGRLARQVAAINAQGIGRAHPLLSGALPDGSRIQSILPPATRGEIAIAIRKHVAASMRLDDYLQAGAFDAAVTVHAEVSPIRDQPRDVSRAVRDRLASAVRERRNILVSGGTSTGKTTFLNALLHESAERSVSFLSRTPSHSK